MGQRRCCAQWRGTYLPTARRRRTWPCGAGEHRQGASSAAFSSSRVAMYVGMSPSRSSGSSGVAPSASARTSDTRPQAPVVDHFVDQVGVGVPRGVLRYVLGLKAHGVDHSGELRSNDPLSLAADLCIEGRPRHERVDEVAVQGLCGAGEGVQTNPAVTLRRFELHPVSYTHLTLPTKRIV